MFKFHHSTLLDEIVAYKLYLDGSSFISRKRDNGKQLFSKEPFLGVVCQRALGYLSLQEPLHPALCGSLNPMQGDEGEQHNEQIADPGIEAH